MEATSTHAAREQAFEALETEITDLWGHITAATYRFLELVAEFDRTEGWGRHGVASCAQWLNLHCGIGPGAAREKVRVARALEQLPKISEAFRCGQISYSKVRAMTRVATPVMEDTLVNIALYGTATHIERLVREFRQIERIEEAELAEQQYRDRFLQFRYDDDATMVVYARLPREVGEVVRKAIEAAMEGVEARREDGRGIADVPAGTPASGDEYDEDNVNDPIRARRADGLRLLAEQFLASESQRCPSAADRYQVVVHIDQAVLSRGDLDRSQPPGRDRHRLGRSEIEDGSVLAADTARRLACGGALVGIVEDANGNPLDVGRKTRAISPAMKRALKARDGGCRFPGCDRSRFTEGHHVKHWADGGETKLPNLITLCRFHHRLIHEGGFGLRATDDGLFVFSRPDGRRLDEHGHADAPAEDYAARADYGTSEQRADEPGFEPRQAQEQGGRAERSRGNALAALNEAREVTVARAPGWHGERMTYWWAVERMLWEKRVGMG